MMVHRTARGPNSPPIRFAGASAMTRSSEGVRSADTSFACLVSEGLYRPILAAIRCIAPSRLFGCHRRAARRDPDQIFDDILDAGAYLFEPIAGLDPLLVEVKAAINLDLHRMQPMRRAPIALGDVATGERRIARDDKSGALESRLRLR